MTELLLENPWPVCVMAVITAVLLAAGAIKTGRAGLLYGSAAALLIAMGLVLLERWIVTPREEIASTLHQIARDLEANDMQRVLSHISTSATELRSEINSILPRIVIQRATVKPNLEVELFSGDPPNAAKAKFNGVIVASEKRGGLENQHGAWFFVVDFRREDNRWRVWRYERRDPRQGI